MKIPKAKKLAERLSHSHARAPKQEKEIANRMGGRTVRGSGSGSEKGDVRVKGVCRIECKTTKAASFSVTRSLIDKIDEVAIAHGEIPAIVVEFNEAGVKVAEVAVIPVYALEMLLEGQRR